MDEEDHHFIKSLEQQWTCSISKMAMKDPVVTADGHTYDRQSIAQWLQNEHKSPNTGLELQSTNLIPNIAFKNLVEKLKAELPGFLAKEEGFETYIQQLKEEIDYLKVQLQHEKEKNDEHVERQEKEFKTKRIQKSRHEDKNTQLKIIREQKNAFQKELQELRTKEQKQSREIRLLKEELSSFMKKYSDTLKEKKEFQSLYNKVQENRIDFMDKIKGSFSSNLVFIGHLLQSIEDAKTVEAQLNQKEKGTQETIVVQHGQTPQQNQQTPQNGVARIPAEMNAEVIKHLQLIIRDRVNGLRRDNIEEESEQDLERQERMAILRRRLLLERRRRSLGRLNNLPNSFRGIEGSRGPTIRMLMRPNRSPIIHEMHSPSQHQIRNVPRNIFTRQNPNRIVEEVSRPQPQSQSQSQIQPQPQPQPQASSTTEMLSRILSQLQNQHQPQTEHQPQPGTQPQPQNEMPNIFTSNPGVSRDSGLYKQLQSIKWMMSKRNYRQLPYFYDYQFVAENNDPNVFWYGVRLRVFQSKIPFAQFFVHSWNHVRILDLSACNIDDELWQKFIQCSKTNFKSVTSLDLNRNSITTIKKTDLERFWGLRKVSINRNKLSSDSKQELNDYATAHSLVKVEFMFNDGEEGSDDGFLAHSDMHLV